MDLHADEHQTEQHRAGVTADDEELVPRPEGRLELWVHTATGSRYSPKTPRKTPHISPSVT